VQIARALESAHERGITHRDLKPANIKLTTAGDVKVLDFGLARMDVEPNRDLSDSPTVLTVTTPGVIVGTAAYMSPEQAKGLEVGKTTDVWAFGCVLYEMLTARRAFDGDSVSEILATVLKVEPDWSVLPPLPSGIVRLLHRCLRKDRTYRLQSIADARIEIEDAQAEPQSEGQVVSSGSKGRRLLATVSLLAMSLIALSAVFWRFRPEVSTSEMRLEISVPPTTNPGSLALSPDGRRLVYVADWEGRPHLWLRTLDSTTARAMPGTGYPQFPFWSPDSESIGFFADGKLKRISVAGGLPQSLTATPQGFGGTWNKDGTIVFCQNNRELFRIPDTGGDPVMVTELDRPRQSGHRDPFFLNDGTHFVYFATGAEGRGAFVGSLESSKATRILPADAFGVGITPSGELLFVRQGSLYAQDMDSSSFSLTGQPSLLAESVVVEPASRAAVSVSKSGIIVYRAGSVASRQLAWFDRAGREIEKVGKPDTDNLWLWSVSPDRRHLALNRTTSGNFDVWLIEITRGLLTRLTSDARFDRSAIWSPDGTRILFSSGRTGAPRLYARSVSGAPNSETLLAPTTVIDTPTDWSKDGRFVLYNSVDQKTGSDIWALPMDREGKPGPPGAVVQTNALEEQARFSPDGNWVAFQSNESGQMEIYLQPFPGPGSKTRVSTNGGIQAMWSSDGRELFYLALDGKLMAVPIKTASSRSNIEPGAAIPLFWTRMLGADQPTAYTNPEYIVSGDGKQFLMNTKSETPAGPITVILNRKSQRKSGAP
jgi:Tol biopolymer transport system component